ncbi:MAG: TetR family transcriptional regulator [Gammaproteobacteria bacterium]|nr:TetR family transcriptional regulator [Gammaproteobacteria bacterium]
MKLKLTRREALGVESRRKIIGAASALMAERGFAGTSISSISKKSGLPSGSIYWHFANKQAILAAVVEEGAKHWFETLPSVDAPADKIASSLEDHPEFLRLLFLIALERREVDDASLDVIRRARSQGRERLRTEITSYLQPVAGSNAQYLAKEYSTLALAMVDGAFVAHHIDPQTTDIPELFRLLRRALRALAREVVSSES